MSAFPNVPDWLRVLGSVVTVLSFVPQLHRICSIKDSSGLSLYYILLNLLLKTEECAIFFFILFNIDEADSFIHNPPSTGDWLNLCQVSVVWILFFLFFLLAVYYQPQDQRVHKWVAMIIYIGFLFISLVPEISDAVFGTFKGEDGRLESWTEILFGGGHLFYILPTVTLLCPISVIFQARLIPKRKGSGLSIVGVAVQTIVFTLIGVLWLGRIKYYDGPYDGPGEPGVPGPPIAFYKWFIVSGWPAVDNLIFALVQGVLFCLAAYTDRGRIRMDEGPVQDGESEPLLGHRQQPREDATGTA